MSEGMRRQYIWEQTADYLRQGIRDGKWAGTLPPERLFIEELRVSRDQLRLALNCLRKEGWIKRSGRRHQVCGQVEEPSGLDRQVVVISALKQAEQSHNSLEILDRLRDSMGRAGTSINVRTVPALTAKRPGRRLEDLVESSPHALWVLHQAGKPAQEWFLRSGLPTAVLGTSLEDLPGVDLDHLSMAHHCIGLLRRRLQGEPRVILFRTDRETIGLAKTEHLMEQELEDFQVVIDRSENKFIPTAIERFKHCDVVLTKNERQAIGVSGWLERDLGRRVGRDVSVISLAGSPILQFAWPSIAHYTVDGSVMERHLRKIIHRLEKGVPGGKPVTIMSDFIDGASMAKS